MKSYYKTLSKEKQKKSREILQMLDGDHAKPLIDLQKGKTFYVDGVKVRVKTLEKDGIDECGKCVFRNPKYDCENVKNYCLFPHMACLDSEREDFMDAVFEPVKEKKK